MPKKITQATSIRKHLARKGPLSRATLRLRIVFSGDRQIGPGKADLLDAIARSGSISSAARDLGMSYRRAWMLADELGRLFKTPILTTAAGGAHGGGAQLTEFGQALLAAYRRIEDRAAAAACAELAAFEREFHDVYNAATHYLTMVKSWPSKIFVASADER